MKKIVGRIGRSQHSIPPLDHPVSLISALTSAAAPCRTATRAKRARNDLTEAMVADRLVARGREELMETNEDGIIQILLIMPSIIVVPLSRQC